MKKVIILAFLITCILTFADAQPKHTFVINDGEFMHDGKPIKIYSGEMHYARIPHEYWRHRLQMSKEVGVGVVGM
jgi:beta-galactosidase